MQNWPPGAHTKLRSERGVAHATAPVAKQRGAEQQRNGSRYADAKQQAVNMIFKLERRRRRVFILTYLSVFIRSYFNKTNLFA